MEILLCFGSGFNAWASTIATTPTPSRTSLSAYSWKDYKFKTCWTLARYLDLFFPPLLPPNPFQPPPLIPNPLFQPPPLIPNPFQPPPAPLIPFPPIPGLTPSPPPAGVVLGLPCDVVHGLEPWEREALAGPRSCAIADIEAPAQAVHAAHAALPNSP
jgi:hypothetical protein